MKTVAHIASEKPLFRRHGCHCQWK